MKLINVFFEYTGIILIFINALLYLIGYKHFKSVLAYKYFSWYLFISFLVSTSAFVLAKLEITNLFLSHFYFISQFLLLSLFYSALFKKNQKKYVFIVILLVCVILAIQYALKPSLFYHFNLFEIFITSLPIVVYAIIHLYNSLSNTNKFLKINSGVLIYITSSTLIFILGNYISYEAMNSDVKRNIYLINKILYVVYLTLILIQWKTSFQPVKNKS